MGDMGNYTQHIEDHYWGLVTLMQQNTKNQLHNIHINDAKVEISAAIEQFRIDYTCSARRYLMNYFQRRSSSVVSELGQYAYVHNGSVYMFNMVTDENVQELHPDERDEYIRLICEVSAKNSGDDEREWRPLIRKAMLWNKRLELLTKEEAFRIGHGLKFSLEEMDSFLLRVLDNDGLSYANAEDVIEAFCFLYEPANNHHIADNIKRKYHARSKNIPKVSLPSKPEQFTVAVEVSLQSMLERWTRSENDVIAQFIEWLLQKAPYMDVNSRSAHQVYCRLALMAYELTTEPQSLLNENDFSQNVIDTCSKCAPLPLADSLSYKMSESILRAASLEFDNLRKRQPNQIWRYVTVDQKGQTTAVAIGNRIPKLLLGEEGVTKADILFMLWYIGDLYWIESGPAVTGAVIYERVASFWSTAEKLLDMARLPGFYAPHMLERCFLKAICTHNNTNEYPFEVYEGMCEFVLPAKQERTRSKQGKRVEKSRALMEKEVMEAYASNQIDFERIETRLFEHLKKYGAEKGKYSFSSDGISYLPNPEVVIGYPDEETGKRFDLTNPGYAQSGVAEERFRFVYGLSLYLQDRAKDIGIRCEFRTNYQKNVTLTILCWDQI